MGNNNENKVAAGIGAILRELNPFDYPEVKVIDNDIEEKAFSASLLDAQFSFADYLGGGGLGDLQAMECIRLYKRCNPLFTAVNMRAEAFSSIPVHAVSYTHLR